MPVSIPPPQRQEFQVTIKGQQITIREYHYVANINQLGSRCDAYEATLIWLGNYAAPKTMMDVADLEQKIDQNGNQLGLIEMSLADYTSLQSTIYPGQITGAATAVPQVPNQPPANGPNTTQTITSSSARIMRILLNAITGDTIEITEGITIPQGCAYGIIRKGIHCSIHPPTCMADLHVHYVTGFTSIFLSSADYTVLDSTISPGLQGRNSASGTAQVLINGNFSYHRGPIEFAGGSPAPPARLKVCDCGSAKCGLPTHSSWCSVN